jgi:hypothetical protein
MLNASSSHFDPELTLAGSKSRIAAVSRYTCLLSLGGSIERGRLRQHVQNISALAQRLFGPSAAG